MAKDASDNSKKKSGKRITSVLMLLVFGSMISPPTALVFWVGMTPSYLAWFSDREKGRLTGITVAATNLATLTFVLASLWDKGTTMKNAIALINSPFTWALMLVGALLGWVMAQVVPMIIVGVISARDKIKLDRVRARQKQLIEEWGQDITEVSK